MRGYGFAEPIETVGKLASVNVASEYSDYLIRPRPLRHLSGVGRREDVCAADDQRTTYRAAPVVVDGVQSGIGRGLHRHLGRGSCGQVDRGIRPSEPFFQWVGFPGPHDPWDAPERYVDRYRNVQMPMPGSHVRPELPAEGPFRSFLEYFVNVYSDSSNLTDDVIAEVRRYYYGNLTLIDDAIGRILDALERRGLLDDTWVIYTSDHGEMMGEHRMLSKMVPYEPA